MKLSQQEINDIRTDAVEKYKGLLLVAIAAFIHGDLIIRRCGNVVPSFADMDRINDFAAQIEAAQIEETSQTTETTQTEEKTPETPASLETPQSAGNTENGDAGAESETVSIATEQPAQTETQEESTPGNTAESGDASGENKPSETESDNSSQTATTETETETPEIITERGDTEATETVEETQTQETPAETIAPVETVETVETSEKTETVEAEKTEEVAPTAKDLTDADFVEVLKNYKPLERHVQDDLAIAIYGESAIVTDGETRNYAPFVNPALVSSAHGRLTKFVNSLPSLVENYKGE